MAAEIESLAGFGDVLLLRPRRIGDIRGYFSETYRESDFATRGVHINWVQENESLSSRKGTLRGMHFQRGPHAQAKLVRCVNGAIHDVVVDIRPGSKTFGQHASVELSEENGLQIYVPEGFAHGFCTLTDNCRLIYRTSDYYTPTCDAGIAHDDPDLSIDWPFAASDLILSDKDQNLPRLKDIPSLVAANAGEA